MRKGRSSRRSRTSRPVSKAPPPAETLGAESATPSNPRIVVSTPPPASLKTEAVQPSLVPSELEPETRKPSSGLETKASEPPPEPEPGAKTSEAAPEAIPPEAKALPDESVSSPPPETRPSATLPPPSPGGEAPKEPSVTLASTDDIPRERPPAASEEPVSSGDGDEPESAEHVAIQEQFFSEGDLSRLDHDHDDIEPMRPSKAVRMAEPEVVQRRARYSRYVGYAVAGAAIVCLAALTRTLVGGNAEKPAPVLETRPGPPLTIERPPEPKPAESVAPPAPEPSASGPASASAAPEEAPAPSRPTGDAKEEKKKAQTALEQRKIPDAITAGEASVALDPTDGEAWLILGAAYQEKGDIAAARRSFASCVKEGKTGPVAECGKMLR